MLIISVHSGKAPTPILLSDLGWVTLFNSSQPSNAFQPILVTEFGMVMLVRPLQPLERKFANLGQGRCLAGTWAASEHDAFDIFHLVV